MPEPRDITTRGVEDRVVGYGDRTVAQGARATTPSAAMTSVSPKAAPPPPQPAIVTLYDPHGSLKGSVLTSVRQRLEQDLNAMAHASKTPSNLVAQLGIRFQVRHEARMSARDERFKAGVFDFPVYLLHARGGSQTSAAQIRELMLDHGIRDGYGPAHQQFKQAEAEWPGRAEGLGIQPLRGWRKVGFVKADNLLKASDFVIAFSNVIKHELGHMMNLWDHRTGEVMRVPAFVTAHLDYSQTAKELMLAKLEELKREPQDELERRYVRQNP